MMSNELSDRAHLSMDKSDERQKKKYKQNSRIRIGAESAQGPSALSMSGAGERCKKDAEWGSANN